MLWFGKRRKTEKPRAKTSKAPAPSVAVESQRPTAKPRTEIFAPAHLPNRLNVELYQIAERKPLTAQADLVATLQDEPGGRCLVLDTALELKARDMPGRGSLIQEPYLLITPSLLEQLSSLQLIARTPGQLLCFQESALAGASEELHSHLDAWISATESVLLRALAEDVNSLVKSHRMLSNTHRQQLMKQETRFAESNLVAEVLARIPRLPVGTTEILAALTSEKSTSTDITNLIRKDAGLSSLLLKAINSPQYSLGAPVSDVERCIVLLGFEGAYDLVMSSSLKRSLPSTPKFQRSYERSVELAQIAFSVAQVSGRAKPSEMSTLALLSDVGLLVAELISRKHPAFKELIAMVEPSKFGGALLKSWGLPDLISQTLSIRDLPNHTPPHEIDAALRSEVAVLHLSECLHSAFIDTETGRASLFIDDYLAVLGWPGVAIDELWQKQIIPNLKKRRSALPVSLRRL